MSWYRIRNAAGGPAKVFIYDEVGVFGVTAAQFVADLQQLSGPLDVHLSSPGGDVFDGIAIYQALRQHPGAVTVVVDSLAASIASVIAMAADPGQLEMAPNATMMIHDAYALVVGAARDMLEMALLLDSMSDNIASIYAERTGQSEAVMRRAMQAETWYVGQEAVDAGLADRVQAARQAAGRS